MIWVALRPELPTGTVTFLFTDVEGSTALLAQLGAEEYAKALADHRTLIRQACTSNDGVEVDTQGDAFFFAFPTASGALAAASRFTEQLATSGPIRVRAGAHTGTPLLGDEGYVGHDVHRAARIAATGHGGQVLVSASTASLVELELTDLGEHRFKDLGSPEHVYQLGSDTFPPLKSLYATNLPVPATAFVGRERELREVVELLDRDDARLVTLTGPGGTGKTRLTLQAAAEASEGFPDGVHWIPLAPLRDETAVGATFAQALQVRDRPGLDIATSIVSTFSTKRSLIVVDNCEHVVGGVADLVGQLVGGCPKVLVVASSRERLGLQTERIYEVPPMAIGDGHALFVERASTARPGFQPDERVNAICEAVDQLPLAIELAAARVRALSTTAIHERLSGRLGLLASRNRDVEERQRTLEATIAWSYELLDDEERQVLRGLSVFVGGCTFAIMSVSKPFVFALVARELGPEDARETLGVNATGLPFDATAAVEESPDGRTNPMVNPGAIATTSFARGRTAAERWRFLYDGLSRFAGRALSVDDDVYSSASQTNFRNRALAALLDERGRLGCDQAQAVDLYTRQCSLQVTARDLALMGATLADGGVHPLTGERVVDEDVCRYTLAVMTTAGLYETSGDWLYDVGIPGKSGIGGGIVTVAPGKGGLGTFSPRLDAAGNSVRGQLAARFLARELGLDLFASAAPEDQAR
jgi:glutaminase